MSDLKNKEKKAVVKLSRCIYIDPMVDNLLVALSVQERKSVSLTVAQLMTRYVKTEGLI